MSAAAAALLMSRCSAAVTRMWTETRHPLADISDIYQFGAQLKESVRRYDSPASGG